MRCTECSKEVRPIIAVDIDGTLGDYHGHFERFAAGWLGWERNPAVEDYDGRFKYNQWFQEAYGCSYEVWQAIKLAYRQGGLKRTMPVHEYAATLSGWIRERAELWILTTRPYLRLDSIDPDTRDWLRRHRIQYDHLMYGPYKYRKLADQVDPERVIAVVDDDLNHLAEAEDLGWNTILRQTRYNRGILYPYTASDLQAVRRLLQMTFDEVLVDA